MFLYGRPTVRSFVRASVGAWSPNHCKHNILNDRFEQNLQFLAVHLYLWVYVYFSDTEASQACFRLLHDDDDDDDDYGHRWKWFIFRDPWPMWVMWPINHTVVPCPMTQWPLHPIILPIIPGLGGAWHGGIGLLDNPLGFESKKNRRLKLKIKLLSEWALSSFLMPTKNKELQATAQLFYHHGSMDPWGHDPLTRFHLWVWDSDEHWTH